MTITSLDHLVLTVADLDASLTYYGGVLGMTPITFGDGRHAVAFGAQKINLHEAGHEIAPHARRPAPGSADLCFLVDEAVEDLVARLHAAGVIVEEGPVRRTGAQRPLTSVYVRDPDGNLIELSRPA
jgi:catechol 2,3-dioxygenase-like lactoylglutathione lyase family enzyme